MTTPSGGGGAMRPGHRGCIDSVVRNLIVWNAMVDVRPSIRVDNLDLALSEVQDDPCGKENDERGEGEDEPGDLDGS